MSNLTPDEIVTALLKGQKFSRSERKQALDTLEWGVEDAITVIQDHEVAEHDKGMYRNRRRTYLNAIAQLKSNP